MGRLNTNILALGALILMSACANYSALPELAARDPIDEGSFPEYRIEPGDTLDVKFFYSSDLNETITVRPDGMISMQLVDDVQAAGRTPSELDADLTSMYSQVLPEEQDVTVILRGFGDTRIYVAGEVANPGEFALKNHMTPFQAVTAAGGFKTTGDRNMVLVIRQDGSGNSAVMKTDLSDNNIVAALSSAHAMLAPRDIVYVPRTGIAQANLFVDQYVRQLLLFNGFGVGVNAVYELNNKDEFSTP